MRGLKHPHSRPLFSSIFDNLHLWAKHFLDISWEQSRSLGGSTITIIQTMCQACTCGRVLARGPTPSAPKQWKSDVHVKS